MIQMKSLYKLLAMTLVTAAPALAIPITFSDYDGIDETLDGHDPYDSEYVSYFDIEKRGYDRTRYRIHHFQIVIDIDDSDGHDEWGGFKFGTDPLDNTYLFSSPTWEIDDQRYTFNFYSSNPHHRSLFEDLWEDGILRYQVFATRDPYQPVEDDDDNDFKLDWAKLTAYACPISDTGSALGLATLSLASLGFLRRRFSK